MFEYLKTELNEYHQVVGAPVETDEIDKFHAEQLNGRWCKVIPVNTIAEEDEDSAFRNIWRTLDRDTELDNAKAIWTYMRYDGFNSQDDLKASLKTEFGLKQAQHYLVQVGHQYWGWMGLINIDEMNRKAEIGNIFFSDQLRHTTAATEAIYLLLNQCFDYGFRKVEWRCDESNEASVNAAVRFGFLYEGTLRQDRIVKGRNRNTACFSILDEEWQKLKLAFEDWLKQDNFNLEREQKIRLEDFMKLYPITGRKDKK